MSTDLVPNGWRHRRSTPDLLVGRSCGGFDGRDARRFGRPREAKIDRGGGRKDHRPDVETNRENYRYSDLTEPHVVERVGTAAGQPPSTVLAPPCHCTKLRMIGL